MQTLSEKARVLRDRCREIQAAPFLQRPALASEFAEDVAEFLVEVATQMDAIAFYVDEVDQ